MKSNNLNIHVWPMWLLIANLPITVRPRFPNVSLLTVYARIKTPNWIELKANDLSLLNGPRKTIIKQEEFIFNSRLLYLVTDIVATALNSVEGLVVFIAMTIFPVEKTAEAGSIFLTKK